MKLRENAWLDDRLYIDTSKNPEFSNILLENNGINVTDNIYAISVQDFQNVLANTVIDLDTIIVGEFISDNKVDSIIEDVYAYVWDADQKPVNFTESVDDSVTMILDNDYYVELFSRNHFDKYHIKSNLAYEPYYAVVFVTASKEGRPQLLALDIFVDGHKVEDCLVNSRPGNIDKYIDDFKHGNLPNDNLQDFFNIVATYLEDHYNYKQNTFRQLINNFCTYFCTKNNDNDAAFFGLLDEKEKVCCFKGKALDEMFDKTQDIEKAFELLKLDYIKHNGNKDIKDIFIVDPDDYNRLHQISLFYSNKKD